MPSPYTTHVRAPAPDEATEQQVAALATFASGLVHDIRNPLNVIRTNLYLLRQRVGTDDARAARPIDRIDDQVTASLRLLEGIQAFYRADRPTLQRVHLNEVARSVVASTPAVDGAELVLNLDESLPLIEGDPQLLEAALRALIRNAHEAAGAGPIRVVTGKGNGSVRLAVADSGPGIAEADLGRVFEPLFTTRRGHGGIGLALVARVARGLGGCAFIETGEGAGTLAGLELPDRA
jgi:signal transduction histidine kinase